MDVPSGDPKIWPVYDLQVVPAGTVSIPSGAKVSKKVVAAERAEYQARSGPEQRAALEQSRDHPHQQGHSSEVAESPS